jgi:hypothetical protein
VIRDAFTRSRHRSDHLPQVANSPGQARFYEVLEGRHASRMNSVSQRSTVGSKSSDPGSPEPIHKASEIRDRVNHSRNSANHTLDKAATAAREDRMSIALVFARRKTLNLLAGWDLELLAEHSVRYVGIHSSRPKCLKTMPLSHAIVEPPVTSLSHFALPAHLWVFTRSLAFDIAMVTISTAPFNESSIGTVTGQ